MYVRRNVDILKLFMKYTEKSKIVTPACVVIWYLSGSKNASLKLVLMLKCFIREGIIKPACNKCFIQDMLNACCY